VGNRGASHCAAEALGPQKSMIFGLIVNKGEFPNLCSSRGAQIFRDGSGSTIRQLIGWEAQFGRGVVWRVRLHVVPLCLLSVHYSVFDHTDIEAICTSDTPIT
jgi:hypothetical protein